MIYLHFVYKGCIVDTRAIEKAYTQRNIDSVRKQISAKLIHQPENQDRIFFSEQPIDTLFVG